MARSLSKDEFDRLRLEVGVLIVTAMQVEADAVNAVLDTQPLAEGVLPRYQQFRFGYFGKYLAAHIVCGQAGLRSAVEVTSALAELRGSDMSHSFYVLMPGICCGLKRSMADTTTIARNELNKYLSRSNKNKLPLPIAIQLKSSLKTGEDRIVLPTYMTPESTSTASTQCIGDILVASNLWQHNYRATKADRIEDRGGRFEANPSRMQLLLDHAKEWRQTSPDADYGPRRCQVHSGLIISGDELLNHFNRREELRSEYKDAIGLDMEGHGLGISVLAYTAKEREGQAWFLFAKGICDWGVGKGDDWQEHASKASVSLLHHCLDDPNFFSGLVQPIDKAEVGQIFALHKTIQPLANEPMENENIGLPVLENPTKQTNGPSLSEALGHLKHLTSVQSALLAEETAEQVVRLASATLSKYFEVWNSDQVIVDVQQGEWYTNDIVGREIHNITSQRLFGHGVAQTLVRAKNTLLPDVQIQAGVMGNIHLRPRPAFGEILPSFHVTLVMFGTQEGRMGFYALLYACKNTTLLEWSPERIEFVKSLGSPAWEDEIPNIVRRLTGRIRSGIEWASRLNEHGCPLPSMSLYPQTAEVKVTDVENVSVSLAKDRHETLLSNEPWDDAAISPNGKLLYSVQPYAFVFDLESGTRYSLKGNLLGVRLKWSYDGVSILSVLGQTSSAGEALGVITATIPDRRVSEVAYYNGSYAIAYIETSPRTQNVVILFRAATNYPHILAVLEPDGTTTELMRVTDTLLGFPTWTPDCSAIYFTRYFEGGKVKKEGIEGIWSIDIETSSPRLVIPGQFNYPVLSMDGRLLAYIDFSQGNHGEHPILVSDANGRNSKQVAVGGSCIGWLPDHVTLLFVRPHGTQKGVWSIRV